MMEESIHPPKTWAILIGINFFGGKAKLLRGSVEDVRNMGKFLSGRGVGHVDIFLSSEPLESTAQCPPEDATSWPTYDNIVTCLKEITNKAQPGDFVYIHFSGHGCRTPNDGWQSMDNRLGHLALVLYDRLKGIRYLHGVELASLINRMVSYSLFVTLTLDCCNSGDVIRDGDARYTCIRGVKYNPTIDANYPLPNTYATIDQTLDDTFRNARENRDHLTISPNYTMICACSPHEIAEELLLSGNIHTGALSHFLLRALKRLQGTKVTTKSLYHHLRLVFQLHWPQQTPECFGRREMSFFGKLVPRPKVSNITALTRSIDGTIFLDAGIAHGVLPGDEYDVFPLNASDDSQPSFLARAKVVDQLRSQIQPTSALGDEMRGETRWKARARSLPSQGTPIRVMIDGVQDRWTQLANSIPYLRLVFSSSPDETCPLAVALNDNKEYQFLDESNRAIESLPKISAHEKDAEKRILRILAHLATFKCVQGIDNLTPEPSFEESFEMKLAQDDGDRIEAGEVLTVKHGDEIKLTVENFGSDPLYLVIFVLGPWWQIVDLLDGPDGADFKVVTPKASEKQLPSDGFQNIPMSMEIPEAFSARGWSSCEDIIKVIVTSMATSFPELSLPEIHHSEEEPEDMRMASHGSNLSAFLSSLTEPLRGPQGPVLGEQWTTRSFKVRTVAQDEKS